MRGISQKNVPFVEKLEKKHFYTDTTWIFNALNFFLILFHISYQRCFHPLHSLISPSPKYLKIPPSNKKKIESVVFFWFFFSETFLSARLTNRHWRVNRQLYTVRAPLSFIKYIKNLNLISLLEFQFNTLLIRRIQSVFYIDLRTVDVAQTFLNVILKIKHFPILVVSRRQKSDYFLKNKICEKLHTCELSVVLKLITF